MHTIVFIETNKSGSSREAIKAAEKLNFFTVLLTNKKKFLKQRAEFPDVHQMIFTDLNNYDSLITLINKLRKDGKSIQGIFSFVDPFVHLAARLSENYSCNNISTNAIQHMEDKILTRQTLKESPLSLNYWVYKPNESLASFLKTKELKFPIIIKSPKSSGSKDVLFAKDKDHLISSMEKISKKYPNKEILLEEYVDGPQYLVEVLVHNGTVHIIAIIEQEITFFERFIITGYCLLGEADDKLQNSLLKATTSILQTLNMTNGACHIEFRKIKNNWKLIEINPRISGGAMNHMIEIGHGINLVQKTIQLMLGQQPSLVKKHYKYVYAHYLTVHVKGELIRVTGKQRSSSYSHVEEVCIQPRKGNILRPPTSMGHRCGYILTSSYFKEEAKRIALKAAKEINFEIKPIDIK
ncbi:ATP-grasp domain-containing protein [Bacillus thuringiensis]